MDHYVTFSCVVLFLVVLLCPLAPVWQTLQQVRFATHLSITFINNLDLGQHKSEITPNATVECGLDGRVHSHDRNVIHYKLLVKC